jgi:hypothetical protein
LVIVDGLSDEERGLAIDFGRVGVAQLQVAMGR